MISLFFPWTLFWAWNLLFRSWFIRQRRIRESPLGTWQSQDMFPYIAEKNLCRPFWLEWMLLKVHSWVLFCQGTAAGTENFVPERTKVCSNVKALLCVLRNFPRCPRSLSSKHLHAHLWVAIVDSFLAHFLLMALGKPHEQALQRWIKAVPNLLSHGQRLLTYSLRMGSVYLRVASLRGYLEFWMVAWNFGEWSSLGKSCAGSSQLIKFILSALW